MISWTFDKSSLTIILPFISFKVLFVITICEKIHLQLHISGS